jgi:hypothetical protein
MLGIKTVQDTDGAVIQWHGALEKVSENLEFRKPA